MTLSVAYEQKARSAQSAVVTVADVEPLIVLKFGSSVLRTIEDLSAVAGEIYRQRRKGMRIVAVVSALAGETDQLFQEAALVSAGVACTGAAELVSLGEERTAGLLKIACDRIGLPSAICRAEELGLHTKDSDLDADFVSLLPIALARKLESTGVVIVPGFVGLGEHGQRTLLGRGGSDFTAAILGGELGAETVRLYKDVDGVFESDPALVPSARKFEQVSYEEALRLARPLVHSKAVEFAAARRLPIQVEAIGSCSPTRIGGDCKFNHSAEDDRPLRLALAGFGVVGQALARRLACDPRFEIAAILVRDVSREREFSSPVRLTNDVSDFASTDADVLVELLSCERTGAALCCDMLRNGIPVVTASKRVVSERFSELTASATAGRAPLLFSAAVGGSAPFLETIQRAREEGRIGQVRGILNGTVNFVLQRLNEGVPLSDALEDARNRGFAEENCEADLSGADAAAKLKIIAHCAFGVPPEDVEVTADRLDEALAAQVQASGERWVQLSEVGRSNGKIAARVRFCPASLPQLWPAPDEWNVGVIRLEDGREIGIRGRGAGGAATAEAVLADLYELHDRRSSQTLGVEGISVPEALDARLRDSSCHGLA